jgi:dihydrofolate reductase
MTFSVVVAADRKGGIGRNGKLPWRLKGDMRFFRELTTCPVASAVHALYRLRPAGFGGEESMAWESMAAALEGAPLLPEPGPQGLNALLMGRKTWDSLPVSFRPLPHRRNGVISRTSSAGARETHAVWPSLDAGLAELGRDTSIKNIFVLGGGEVFAEALLHPDCARIYITDIDAEFTCDTFLPAIPREFRETGRSSTLTEGKLSYRFRLLERVRTS